MPVRSFGFATLACTFVLFIQTAPLPVRADEAPFARTTDLKDAVNAALADKARGRRVLVVFDIDNTLLTVPHDLGSDAWYAQKSENDIPKSPAPEAAREAMFRDSNLLLNAARMDKTQDNADILIAALQAAHIPVFAMSARDPALRGSTERELKRNGIDLSPAPQCGPPLCARRGNIRSDDIKAALNKLKLKQPDRPLRSITVSDGVVLLQGQDKGKFLHLLIHSLGDRRAKPFDDIYFIDDTPHNIEAVVRTAPYLHGRVHIYQYERMWEKSAAYRNSDERQAKAEADMGALRKDLCAAMQAVICDPPSAGTAH
jgi:hypothetical protein